MKRRILSGILVAAMATTMFATTAFAAERSKEVPVTYNNTNIIEDPDSDEQLAKWGVSIPSSIVFTDEAKVVDTTVKLVPKGEEGSIADVENVVVSVTSDNQYKLTLEDGSDEVGYNLIYGENVNNGTVGTLDGTNVVSVSGTAELTGTATAAGEHTDTLTYTVTTTP